MENIYGQFDGMVYQQIVGIPKGTNCAPLISDLFLYCYERAFMSNLQESKRFDLIDKFNNTSRYLDDTFTIENPKFAEHIPDIRKGKRKAYSLWVLFVSKIYCFCKWICVWNIKYSYLNTLWYISLQTNQVCVAR